MLKSCIDLLVCCDQDDEKPPPLPIKKQRNSVSTESDVSATDRPGFLPLYIDDRAKVQYGITGQDQVSFWDVEHELLYDF